MLQKSALDILKSGKNVFLTGLAGSGKTHLLNQYIQYMRKCSTKIAVTASTGIAATHIGGMTIHSWSGLGIHDELSEKDLASIAKKKPIRDRILKTRVLIIDEISMLSARQLTCIDAILRYFKVTPEPFGGIQVVFCGDFLQLPPINRDRLPSQQRSNVSQLSLTNQEHFPPQQHGDVSQFPPANQDRLLPQQRFAFMAPIWAQSNLTLCYLTESYRHKDDNLLKLLSEIRAGEISPICQEMLKDKLNYSRAHPNENAIKLYTHNSDVDAANTYKLEQLPSKIKQFNALTSGKQNVVDALKKSMMAPQNLWLKKDAQVMFVKNNHEENYMNGTLGKVIGFTNDGLPKVETLDGYCITARQMEWNVLDESGKTIASYTQVPLRLAWAITVHKSQGMTLDCAIMNLSKTFEPGQGYVALSRVKTWDGLQLLGCNRNALIVDPLMQKEDQKFRVLSDEAEQQIVLVSPQQLNKIFAQHITKCGGKAHLRDLKDHTTPVASTHWESSKNSTTKKQKLDTYEQTKSLIEAGKDLADIVAQRGLAKSTVIGHLEKLHKDYPRLDLARFKPDERLLCAVRSAIATLKKSADENNYDRSGQVKLTAIYHELKRRYDYNKIKLARVFC